MFPYHWFFLIGDSMFYKALTICVCLGSLYGMEENPEVAPNSPLSFILKEKQKENTVARPQWDFLSELTDEAMDSPSVFEVPLLTSLGATGPSPIEVDTPLSLSAPNATTFISMQSTPGITSVKSHQNALATLFNPNINGVGGGLAITFSGEGLDESQLIAQADGQKPSYFGKGRNQTKSEQSESPSGQTVIAGHGDNKNDFWADAFVEKLKLPANSFSNTVYDTCVGGLIGYDRFMSCGMLTSAVGYSYSNITVAGDVGRGRENQIFALFQGVSYLPQKMYLGYSLYGSVNLNDFSRFVNTGTNIEVAKSSFTSYTLAPHIDFGYDWCVNDWFIVEPFISNDFFFNFQPSYSEHGSPGFNQHQDSFNSGLYIVEPGVNLYERIRKSWGLLILRQEFGYERDQTMFGTNSTASIIGVQNGISTSTGLRDLNLGVFGFQVFARTNKGFYSDAFYRGRWGSGLISNTFHLKVGYFF